MKIIVPRPRQVRGTIRWDPFFGTFNFASCARSGVGELGLYDTYRME